MKKLISRRDTFKGAMLALAATQISAPAACAQGSGGRHLVAYLSRSGNTRVLASALARQLSADLFQIAPRTPWPEDYEEMVDWATDIRESGVNLPLADLPGAISGDGIIFLGFPIWGMAVPGVVTSFLKQYDLSGKAVAPFITHGGYGAGSSLETLKALLPASEILPAFILECDQERATLRALDSWLSQMDQPL